MVPRASFDVSCPVDAHCDALVVGMSTPGLAGVTAVDYLSRHLPCEEVGYVAPEEFPGVTPFANGEPRNHTRIYDVTDSPLALLVGELFVPVWAATAFVDSILEWADRADVSEIVIPYGLPYPHGPDEHEVFSVATAEFRDRRLADAEIEGLTGGILDGHVGDVMSRSLNGDAPPTGAFVTPAHPPAPDLEAALRLIEALESVYDFDVDEAALHEQLEELTHHYAAMADRMNSLRETPSEDRDFPEDRSFM